MVVSRCCKENVYIFNDYYVCEKCLRHCDTVAYSPWMEKVNDTRNDGQIASFFNPA